MELPRPPYISSSLCKDEQAQNQINRAIHAYEKEILKALEEGKTSQESLKHIVNVLVSCKGCSKLREHDVVDNCGNGAHTKVILGKVEWFGIPDRDKCPRMQEAWEALQAIIKKQNEAKNKLKQFCYWQGGCKDDYDESGNQKSWTCTAHLHEGRAMECKYKSFEDAKNHLCVDAKLPKEET